MPRHTWRSLRVLVAQSCLTFCDPMDCIVHQAPLSLGFSRQEYWSGLLFPFPGDLPEPGIEPGSSALRADSLQSEPPGIDQIQAQNQAKHDDWPEDTGRNAHKWFKLSQECGKSLFLSPPLWVYPRVRFFLLINTCFTTFHLYVEIHLYTADGSWSCPWPWIPGVLVVRMQCSPCLGLTSISGQESNPALSHCRPRLPEISWVGWWVESLKVLNVFCRGRMHTSEFI